MATDNPLDPTIPPSGTGCADCLATDNGWWVHLRRCAACGHVGCCDSSPAQHASGHAAATGHPYVQSFEPGEDWFWDYSSNEFAQGPELSAPTSHPADQPIPAPADRIPANWQELLN
ncbi:UBP-type zinc finger domain-containing protein [Gordonia sp. CPCC 205515]|uniref:UBP-type zinc finger domain-containing protein n=1 Tax=Gordonia sp. CPCC 205515 TaxID=3140791 RepID=UPI003AF38F79